MKRRNGHRKKDDFIAPAKRAFRRVARQLRAENAKLGLPLVFGVNGQIHLVEPGSGNYTKERAAILKGITLKKLRAELLPKK